MKNTIKRVVCLALAVCMLVSAAVVFTSCRKKPDDVVKNEYTYKSWASSLGTNWNPHTWENNADSGMMGYIETPFVTMEALDTEKGLYQWVFEMATSITDVTADHTGDLTKYGSILPDGKTAAEIKDSYVYEIALNPNAKWETGEPINADTYIYSMQMLLNPKMRNYRANNYISGTSAIAGAYGYYNSEAPIYTPIVPVYGQGEEPDYSFDLSANTVYLSLTATDMTMASYSFKELCDDYGIVSKATYDAVAELANPYGFIEFNDANKEILLQIMDEYLAGFGMSIYVYDFRPAVEDEEAVYVWDEAEQTYREAAEGETATHVYDVAVDENGNALVEDYYREFLYYVSGIGEKVEYDAVGLYKVDDYTIRYVCQTAYEYNYFLTSCTSNWIVHKATYEANMKEEGGLTVTTYGTSKDTTVSYGPYKMESFQDDKQVVFVQNENWYGYTKLDNGELYSETSFLVDGEKHQQYQTTKVVIDVMEQKAAYTMFLAGELTDYAPTAEELTEYNLSDRLFRADETYTMRWFFNCSINTLKTLDDGSNNDNSIVLSNYNFRKAMSLAINRADFVTVTEGWKPAYSLMNSLYHYDIYNDPNSSYRSSEEAMQAICNLYGVEYGEGTIYPTLKDAYDSINGYNLTEAKALMKVAHDELVEAGLYTSGADIKIQIAWKAGALEAADNSQLAKLNQYLNAAVEGSGFGSIEFEAVGNLPKRYDDVIAGNYAIGWGAWGGAALYPFGMMQCYMDPDYTKIHESGCWNPKSETLELTFTDSEGNTVTDTLTWQEWSQSMEGTGKYATEDNDVKLQILAQLEEKYLNLYYCIPMAGTTICTILSYQVDEYTDEYNLMYGFGGFRLMSWNYTDAEWAAYVAEQGGTLNYK